MSIYEYDEVLCSVGSSNKMSEIESSRWLTDMKTPNASCELLYSCT